MDTLNDKQLGRLWDSIEWSKKELREFRERRMRALRLYVGNNYAEDGASQKTYLNLIALTIKIYMRNLVARAPKVLCSTAHPELKPFAANYELALNKLIDDIQLGKSLRTTVLNSMFGLGIHKVGINQSKTVEIGGVTHDVGQPFADAVMFDDWIHDMTGRNLEEAQFMGNRYFMPYEQVLDAGLFKNTDEMDTDVRRVYDDDGVARSESLSQSVDAGPDTYKQCVQLMDLWLPLDGPNGLIVTLDAKSRTRKPLRTVEWDGPERGPYKLLMFNEVPGNIMPLSEVNNLMDMHMLVNQLYLKLSEQARNNKTILGFRAGGDVDAQRIVSASDGDSIRMDNPEAAKEFTFGGINNQMLAFLLNLKDTFSWQAGNLDSMGGLAAMSGTASQDELLAENSSRAIADMQDAVLNWTKEIVMDLAYYLISDPLIQMPLTKRIPGTDIAIPAVFDPEGHGEDFLKFNFSIEPYSMQHSTPQMKLNTMTAFMTNFVAPMMQTMQQQGLTVDMRGFTRLYSKYADVPELSEVIVSMQGPLQPETGPVGQPPQKAAMSTRRYVRENRTAPTRPGKDNAMMQTLLGGGVQNSEMQGALS